MPQLEHIEAIERRLWGAADTLRANSPYASNEYFLPVMGLVFLRYAYSRYLSERTDSLYKLASRITDICETSSTTNNRTDITRARRTADEARKIAVEQLKQVNYFYPQARWLTERFPEAKLCDVEGLVKLVDRAEIEANDWSLTPGRYVGVAPEEEDENFDFAETLREIHEELDELNGEAVSLAATIKKNFKELGI